ncbi:transposase [Trichosporon asahii var. asahii CBS 2479]|uniref:Transposase n=1 Tax=Trichosporon asahii var. asahii (strain ATCC 90039 / CBS 2479 / JCM 2466 / KCTC 7840 / NBRC 103889/ NCYC 2677 / UAMH 7654) TaxID=1186058 RepID=J5TTU5_TRIAS|nr:transposase [Trichosporon asahii var. asahii CBS 2479]EJT52806.1 transposase [Trichosporon asahii var. asahii CBS 2479]
MSPTLSQYERGEIVGAWKMGHALREMERELGYPYSTIRDIIELYKKTGATVTLYVKPEKQLSPRTKRKLARDVKENPFVSLTELGQEYDVHRTTIARYLAEINIFSRVARRTPFLKAHHINMRIIYAVQYRGFRWDLVIFTDECTICNMNYAPPRCLRPPNEQDNPLYTIPAMAGSRIAVNVWGAMVKGKKLPLLNLTAEIKRREPNAEKWTLTGDRYAEYVLFERLSVYAAELARERGGGWTVEDNVALHHTNLCRSIRNECGFQCIDHPPCSPDLNPIEHLWAYIKMRLARRRQATTKEELWEQIVDVYEREVPQWFIDTLVDSMPEQIETLIEREGLYTGY